MRIWGRARRSGRDAEEVDGYRDLVQIGQGGFGVVYRALQEHLDREVAVKVLALPAIDDAALARFLRECRLTSRLTGHPNVVTVLDTGTTRSGRPYVTTEYFKQGSLRQRLDRDGPLPLKEVLRIGVKIAGALAAAHNAEILHRDIKPENILVSGYGEPALADFGVARLLDASDLSARTDAVTLHHTAPEVLEDTPPSQASDVYALGSTLYQLLSGHPAHRRDTDESIAPVLRRILSEDPPDIRRPEVPEQVMAVVRKAMARRQQDRFADPLALATALQQLQAEHGFAITELPPSMGEMRQPDGELTSPSLSGPPNSQDTARRSSRVESGRRMRGPDSDTSATILRSGRPLNEKAPSKHRRWLLVLASLLAIVTTVGVFAMVRGASGSPEPVASSRTSSPPTTAPVTSAASLPPSPSLAATAPLAPPPVTQAPPPQKPQQLPLSQLPLSEPPPSPEPLPPPGPLLSSEPPPSPEPEPEPVISGYHIENANSGMCLVARPGDGENPVVQVPCDDYADQYWEFTSSASGFQIRNAYSGKCIVTRGESESFAVATTCGSWSDQNWSNNFLEPDRFHNANSGLCLVVRGNQAENQAVQATCGDWTDQLWYTW